MKFKINPKNNELEIKLKTPKAKEGLGWLTDDRRMECEGKAQEGKPLPDYCAGKVPASAKRQSMPERQQAKQQK